MKGSSFSLYRKLAALTSFCSFGLYVIPVIKRIGQSMRFSSLYYVGIIR